LTSGIGEEIGWRGYALPRLQKDYNALSSTVILTIFWVLWHLPLFFYLFDPAIAVRWVFALYMGAIVFTWLFNSTDGSILIAAVFHGCFNYINPSCYLGMKIDKNP
jgi:membrane protease YdiL (CAAX protease family)